MILLVEGLNYTGKTTLANLFSHRLKNWPILKFDVPPENAYNHFRENLCEWNDTHENFIVDRCHFSNEAYHGILGGGVLNPFEWWRIDDLFASCNTWLFLMVDDPIAIHERLQASGPRKDRADCLTRQQIGDIQESFMTCYNVTGIDAKGTFSLPQFLVDGRTTSQFETVCQKIISR